MTGGIGDFRGAGSCLRRRSVLAGITGTFALAHTARRVCAEPVAEPAADGWHEWSRDFLMPDGRVVDHEQGGISHSEGQAYGLLLAQAYGDEAAFARIEAWTRAHLAIRQDSLLAWKWQPDPQDGNGVDWRNATDGDLLRAWALLRACRDSGWSGYDNSFRAIARDLVALCLAPDPRALAEHLLLPGAEARRAPDRVLVNPSYFMPRALRELGEAAQEPKLVACADHAETVLAELAAAGRMADWIDITARGFDAPREHDLRWGYDALRIPLYLVWSGQAAHPAVAQARAMMLATPLPDHVAVVIGVDGAILATSDHAGFRAIPELALCRHLDGRNSGSADGARAPYYPATLALLADVALRESGCRGASADTSFGLTD